MRYISTSTSSVYFPKLLGIYEKELHGVIDLIARSRPDAVINLGAAEGYYAVGMALLLPQARIIAFEEQSQAQEHLRELARLNGVHKRIEIYGRCEPDNFSESLCTTNAPAVICDIEGYEQTLIDPELAPGIARAQLLIELHEFCAKGIGDLLRARLATTHACEEIFQKCRQRRDYPFHNWYTNLLPEAYATYMVNEFRPAPMSWLWCAPRRAALSKRFDATQKRALACSMGV